MLAILFALREELKPLLREFAVESKLEVSPATILKGHWKNFPLVLVQTGIGMERARGATQKLLDYFQPNHVLSVGYAGGLQPQLRVGDLIIPREVCDESNHSRALDPEGEGRLLTVRQALRTVTSKQQAGEQGYVAVDMETYAEVEILQTRNIPCSALRIIFDSLAEPLELESDKIGPSLLRNPKLLLKLPRLYQTHLLCQKKLYATLADLIPKLADQSNPQDGE